MVQAVAGAGKSTLLKFCAEKIPSRAMALAFNKEAAASLSSKLGSTATVVRTIHSHGFASLKKHFFCSVDQDKYDGVARNLIADADPERKLKISAKAVLRVFDLLRLGLYPMTELSWTQVVVEHEIEVSAPAPIGIAICQKLAEYGKLKRTSVDFVDMIWLLIALDLPAEKYSWVLVDECQDVSRAHAELIRRSILPGGRALFVGDPQQAIYAFAGADEDSWEYIRSTYNATIFPLSVCYRCGSRILQDARRYCPQIEPAPNAPEGIVRTIETYELYTEVKEGDMILCRFTAPLIRLCYSLIAKKIQATVRGRSIGKGLTSLILKLVETSDSVDLLQVRLHEHFNSARAKALAVPQERLRELAQAQLDDKESCFDAIFRGGKFATAGDVVASIEEIFSDHRSSVQLSTIHRVKGLENPRVFLLETDANPENVVGQDRNLRYVAVTRAMSELVYVAADKR